MSLLHDDAVMSMPPYDFWLRGADEMGEWFLGPGSGCRGLAPGAHGGQRLPGLRLLPPGSARVVTPLSPSRCIEISDGRIVGHHNFLDPELFPLFGLPEHL